MINVIFVMVGNKYTPQHVIQLHQQLVKYGPDHKYYVCTDRPNADFGSIEVIHIPPKHHLFTVWNKLWMFSDEFPVKGPCLYFDLDTIIRKDPFDVEIPTDDVDRPFLRMVDCHWKYPSIVRLTNYDVLCNSSVLAWNSNNPWIHNIWNHFQTSGQRDYFVKKYVGIDRYLVHECPGPDSICYFPRDYIRSHKYELPNKDAPVVTFEEVNFGLIDPKQIA